MPEIVNIARCAEHGLHGCRTECFVCGGVVEQVPMVALGDYEALKAEYDAVKGELDRRDAAIKRHMDDALARSRERHSGPHEPNHHKAW